MSKFLTKEELLKGKALNVKKVYFGEDFIYVREMSAKNFTDFRASIGTIDKEAKKTEEEVGSDFIEKGLYVDICIDHISDESGGLLFTKKERNIVMENFSMGSLIKIFQASSGMEEAEIKDPKVLAKN